MSVGYKTIGYSIVTQASDLFAGLRRVAFAVRLSKASQSSAYKRTFLGPLWLTMEQFTFLLIFGYISTAIFGDNFFDRITYVGLGLWMFGLVSDMCVGSARIIEKYSGYRNSDLPLSFSAIRHVVEVMHCFMYRFFGVLPIVVVGNNDIFRFSSLIIFFQVVVAIIFFGFGMSLAVSTLCTRFRDMKPILDLLGRLAFFVTPVFWKIEDIASSNPGRSLAIIQPYNTFSAFLAPMTALLRGDNELAFEITNMWLHSGLAFSLGLIVFGLFGLKTKVWR